MKIWKNYIEKKFKKIKKKFLKKKSVEKKKSRPIGPLY